MLAYTSPNFRHYLAASMLKLLPALVDSPIINHCLQVIVLNSMWLMATDENDRIVLGALADMLKAGGLEYYYGMN